LTITSTSFSALASQAAQRDADEQDVRHAPLLACPGGGSLWLLAADELVPEGRATRAEPVAETLSADAAHAVRLDPICLV